MGSMAKHSLPLMALLLLGMGLASAQVTNNCPYTSHSHDLACLIPDVAKTGGTNLATFNTTLAQVLSQIPVAVPVSGFSLTLDRSLGVYVVPNDSLGSVLTERAETVGKHRLFLGFTYQHLKFDEVDGTDLKNLPTVYVVNYDPKNPTNSLYGSQHNSLTATIDQYTAIAAFGITDRMDLSLTLPFERVQLGAAATNVVQYPGCTPNPTCNVSPSFGPVNVGPIKGSASGPGDLLLNGKYLIWKGERSRLAGGLEVRFPTGDEYNLLGSGATGFRPYLVYSRRGRYTPHANIGYQWNSQSVLYPSASGNLRLPDNVDYSVGIDVGIVKRLTVVSDFIGRYFFDAPRVTRSTPANSQNVTGLPNGHPLFGTPTVGVANSSFNQDSLGVGIKVNPVGRLLISANVLIKLNDSGLRANYVPLVGISYKF